MISNDIKLMLKLEMDAHVSCGHPHPAICSKLMVVGACLRLGIETMEEDDIMQCYTYIADETMNSLILKGLIEPTGIRDDGQMTFGLTERGKEHK